MPNPTLLYSANTWLAYTISQTYYGGEHYVWCNPHPNSRWLPAGLAPLPPSSSPGDIYLALHADIQGGDLHSAKIDQNKASSEGHESSALWVSFQGSNRQTSKGSSPRLACGISVRSFL